MYDRPESGLSATCTVIEPRSGWPGPEVAAVYDASVPAKTCHASSDLATKLSTM